MTEILQLRYVTGEAGARGSKNLAPVPLLLVPGTDQGCEHCPEVPATPAGVRKLPTYVVVRGKGVATCTDA
jgi:hypothetical protein